MSRINALPHLDATNYSRSVLHAEGCTWVEKNCYVDIWIEVLHALGVEPRAILPFTVAIDFEGDQWTFFKPPHDELRELYGVDVQELNVWRPLLEHAVEHLAAGRLISTEADAFWLPDTSGTDYRRQHTKSTIVLADLDVEAQRLGYFHNAGYFMLEGEDFVRTFRVGYEPDPTFMPLFAETVRFDRLIKLPDAALLSMSLDLWRKHLPRVPRTNPIERFQQRFERDLTLMHERGLAYYHAWAFATTRQLGASFELAASNLRWMQGLGQTGLESSIAAFEVVAANCKSFILKGARAVNSRKPFNGGEMFAQMRDAWERGLGDLKHRLGGE
ncbi:MAG: DUF1839 family protein [Pseudomonadota bacterium]